MMIDQLARAACSPAWLRVLESLLILWWVLAVTHESLNHTRLMMTIGALLIAEGMTALLSMYILLPLAPSPGMARASLIAQVLAVPLTRRALGGGRVRIGRRP